MFSVEEHVKRKTCFFLLSLLLSLCFDLGGQNVTYTVSPIRIPHLPEYPPPLQVMEIRTTGINNSGQVAGSVCFQPSPFGFLPFCQAFIASTNQFDLVPLG